MMTLSLVLLLGLTADAAGAGAAYNEGLDALRSGRYDEAVLKFKEALGYEAGETPKLQYRVGAKRFKHAYYPHFEWARARTLQAAGEKNPTRKVQLLQEAVVHLGLTRSPAGRTSTAPARARLAEAEKTAAAAASRVDPFVAAYQALERKVSGLCDREKFVDAFAAVEAEGDLFKEHAEEKAQLKAFIRDRQGRVIESYARLGVLVLDNLATIDPITQAGASLPILKRAGIPAAVNPKPDARSRWLKEFTALYEGELANIRKAPALKADKLVRTADRFDRAAERALAADSFAGFRAATNVAFSMRAARLRAIADQDGPEVVALIDVSEKAGQQCGKILGRRIEAPGAALSAGDLKKYRDDVLLARMGEVASIRKAVESRARELKRMEEAILEAETALVHPDNIGDQVALRRIEAGLAAVQSRPLWPRLPDGTRARLLLARSIAEAIIGLLKGEAAPTIAKRCEERVRAARRLDDRVLSNWSDRLPPKVRTLLEEIKSP